MPNELLPCKCGNNAIEVYGTMFNGIGLKCSNCGHIEVCNDMYPTYAQKQEAIRKWNARTNNDPSKNGAHTPTGDDK